MTITPRSKRHSLYFLDVFDACSGAPLGQLSDISVEGVSILSETPLACPCTYRLRILVPQGNGSEQPLEFEVESRWTRDEGEAPIISHTTGCRITFLTDAERARIERLVSDFGYAKIGEVKVTRETAGKTSQPNGLKGFLRNLLPG